MPAFIIQNRRNYTRLCLDEVYLLTDDYDELVYSLLYMYLPNCMCV